MFASDIPAVPWLRRALTLTVLGGVAPPLTVIAIFFSGAIYNLATGAHLAWNRTVTGVFVSLGVGQVCSWLGVLCFRRAQLWDSRVIVTLWIMGFLSSMTACFTWVFSLSLVPLGPPIVGSIAAVRARARR